MKKDKMREGLIRALNSASMPEFKPEPISPKLAGQILDRWDELVEKERTIEQQQDVQRSPPD